MPAQQGPNGGGSLIIGGRNGGGQNFVGLIDDLAIWQAVLEEDQIKALTEGLSPSGRNNEDDDNDGLPDYYEENLVDNLDDLNGNGTGPGPGSGTGDFDGDGLTDLDEFEETKTNPTLVDTDEDGLIDGVETNTGTFISEKVDKIESLYSRVVNSACDREVEIIAARRAKRLFWEMAQ